MDADKALIERNLTETVIGNFFSVYNELGAGFLESVYENSLAFALRSAGLGVIQQAALPVWFRGHPVGDYKADLLVEEGSSWKSSRCRSWRPRTKSNWSIT